jgi:hypothetical protein
MRTTRRGSLPARTAALAVLAISVLAQSTFAAQARQWKEYRSAEGGFVVLLPGQPALDTKSTTTDAGPIQMHTFMCTTENLYCSVVYYDVPAGVRKSTDQLLDDTCNGFIQGAKLTEKAERRTIDLNGHPGRELIGESPDGSFLLMARYYLVKDRIYLVMVGSAISEASSPEIGRFLDSFRLLAA